MDLDDQEAANSQRSNDPFAGFRRAAVRELFEETGVLLAADSVRGALSPGERERIRRELLATESGSAAPTNSGSESVGWESIETQPDELTPLFEITTPPFAPRRYRTLFFQVELSPGEEPDIWPGELTEGGFVQPSHALEEWRRGERWIAPPVLLCLELLEEYGVEGLPSAARRQEEALSAGELHPVRFSPGIFVAPLETRTKPPATTTNCFLIGEKRVYIVDPASPHESERTRLYDKLDRYVHEGRTLEAVLLTHHHPDHVGGVSHLAERYGLAVGAHPETLDRLGWNVPGEGVPDETFEVTDGQVLDLGTAPDGSEDWSLVALETPGHSPDHLAYRESRYGSFIAGDLLSSLSTVVIDPPEGHLATYLRSLERVAELGVGMIYPSHGPAVRDGTRMLETYLRHRRARESKLIRALEKGPSELDRLLLEVYDDADPKVLHLARRSLLAALIKLREEERSASDSDEGPWRLV